MADKMLIDATHSEETRVVVVRGNRVEEFDFESANRKQLRGNIYLAKVTRVEPSLQAAFVEYGGNRQGFLAFSEIHPDYYQIPVADREALLEEERREQQADAETDQRSGPRGEYHRHRAAEQDRDVLKRVSAADDFASQQQGEGAEIPVTESPTVEQILNQSNEDNSEAEMRSSAMNQRREEVDPVDETRAEPENIPSKTLTPQPLMPQGQEEAASSTSFNGFEELIQEAIKPTDDEHGEDEQIESLGGADVLEEVQERVPRFRRQYKIQEVIKRRQVLLVQVVKEERGSKGAALTTYLSLAGRYSVLMPNTARGGGISRKITSAEDRARLKEISQELDVPEGMGVILRTAGASRTKAEVKRDFEYLLRLWETVRDTTLKSVAPKLVYEEGSLTKRAIRDLYTKDIDEIIVAGEEGFDEARDFMRMLMPSHVKNVKPYKDSQPLFTRYGVESQLDAMFSPVVQLRSGGYIVINQAEALVAIDVNSGRATREHHIEDTALKTNLEAADEIARQLRLRDLAGLIVIDFIDMDETRNNRAVERRLKEALKHDRARIQVGRISHFGLLEMSRQRIRSSVLESSTEKCPVCGGSGHVRSVSSVALQLLRAVEEVLIKGATHNLIARTRSEVAFYVLNHKRAHLRELEERFRITITVSVDSTISGQQSYVIDRGEQIHTVEAARHLAAAAQELAASLTEEEDIDSDDGYGKGSTEGDEMRDAEAAHLEGQGERQSDGERRRRRKRRGRGRGVQMRESFDARGERSSFTHETAAEHAIAHEDHDGDTPSEEGEKQFGVKGEDGFIGHQPGEEGRRRRRRGRRGGRRNRRRHGESGFEYESEGIESGAHRNNNDLHEPLVSDEDASAIAPPFDEGPFAQDAAASQPSHGPEEASPTAFPETPSPSRRRSTIREPAPMTSENISAPPSSPQPTPVISSTTSITRTEPNADAAPKRGWWAKRFLGEKH